MTTLTRAGTTLSDAAGKASERVGRSLHRSRDRVEMQIHRHPAQSLLVAAASGAVIGASVGFLIAWRARANGNHADERMQQ